MYRYKKMQSKELAGPFLDRPVRPTYDPYFFVYFRKIGSIAAQSVFSNQFEPVGFAATAALASFVNLSTH